MKITFKLKPILVAVGFSCISANTWALLSSDKVVVNSISKDKITATASFPTPVQGDLYVATEFGGQFYFMGPGASLFTDKVPYQKDGKFSDPITVLDIPSEGIAPGTYPLYQVITKSGADPFNFENWIGGLSSLGQLEFKINLDNSVASEPLQLLTLITNFDPKDGEGETTTDFVVPNSPTVSESEPSPIVLGLLDPNGESTARPEVDSNEPLAELMPSPEKEVIPEADPNVPQVALMQIPDADAENPPIIDMPSPVEIAVPININAS
ncbi:MAG: hypothetical protein ABL903_09875 [Methylococcales bacterium]